MAQALTVRLPDEDAAEVRRIAQKERRSVSEVAARMLEEWLRTNRYTELEFRDINGERLICVKSRIEVWQVILIARNYNFDVAKTAEHLDLSRDQVQSALDYYAKYPNEIDFALAENSEGFDRLKRIIPRVERFTT